MKKLKIPVIGIIIALILCLVVLSGCTETKMGNRIVSGRDIQTMNYCYIKLGNEEIVRGAVTQWRDYDNSDVVQVLVNGHFYCTSYTNVVLEADPERGSLYYGDSSWAGVEE